eukprot:9471644-Pyramimonas_sp.AAC.1
MCITALRTYPDLLPFFDVETETCNDLPQLCEHARALQEATIQETLNGLETLVAKSLEEEAWIQRQAGRWRRKKEMWSKLRRRVFLLGVLNEDGEPCRSIDESGAALAAHWGQVFKHVPED